MSFSRRVSRFSGFTAGLTVPTFLRKPLYGLWVSTYNVIEEDMLKPLEEY